MKSISKVKCSTISSNGINYIRRLCEYRVITILKNEEREKKRWCAFETEQLTSFVLSAAMCVYISPEKWNIRLWINWLAFVHYENLLEFNLLECIRCVIQVIPWKSKSSARRLLYVFSVCNGNRILWIALFDFTNDGEEEDALTQTTNKPNSIGSWI